MSFFADAGTVVSSRQAIRVTGEVEFANARARVRTRVAGLFSNQRIY
jgi:hypothetical protein